MITTKILKYIHEINQLMMSDFYKLIEIKLILALYNLTIINNKS